METEIKTLRYLIGKIYDDVDVDFEYVVRDEINRNYDVITCTVGTGKYMSPTCYVVINKNLEMKTSFVLDTTNTTTNIETAIKSFEEYTKVCNDLFDIIDSIEVVLRNCKNYIDTNCDK
jgi:hypothetical protein